MIPDVALPVLRRTCLTLQIVVGSLAFGIVVFMVVALVQMPGPLRWDPPKDAMEIYFLIFGTAAFIASFVVPRMITARPIPLQNLPNIEATGNPRGDQAISVAAGAHPHTIVGAAFLEGGAFSTLFGVMQQGSGWCLATAIVLLLVLLTRFPTFGRYLGMIENELRRLDEKNASELARKGM